MAQQEYDRHDPAMANYCPALPYTTFRGQYVTISITDTYDRERPDYHYGIGKKVETIRAIRCQTAAGGVVESPSQWTITTKTVAQVMADLQSVKWLVDRLPDIEQRLTAATGVYRSERQMYAALNTAFGWDETFRRGSGSEICQAVTRHCQKQLTGFSGHWLLNFLVAQFALPNAPPVPKALKPVQLSPYFTIHPIRTYPGGYTLYERRLDTEFWDYCLFHPATGDTFHGPSPRACVRGLREKREKAAIAEKLTTEALTVDVVQERYGFCRTGIEHFCAFNRLDVAGAYTLPQLQAAVAPRRQANAARFGKELRQMGVLK